MSQLCPLWRLPLSRPREALDHYGSPIVRGLYDGTYDTTNLPKELVLSHYFTVREGKIAGLIIVFNKPSPF